MMTHVRTGNRSVFRTAFRRAASISTALAAVAVLLPVVPARAVAAADSVGVRSEASASAGEVGLGVNVGGISDWMPEWQFVDAFRTSRYWISQRVGAGWGLGPALNLDADGWVTKLEKDASVDAAILLSPSPYPAGKFVVTWKGKGKVSIWGGGTTSNVTANRFEFEVGNPGGHFLRISETDPLDYVRDIHVWMPGYEHTGAEQEFHPLFLERLRGMKTLRFMDWMEANNSHQVTWDQYPTEHSARQGNGAAPQIMARLANRVGADPWFTMPHLADDNWIRQFATTIRDTVDPDRKIYVEFSNEVWNGIFAQAKWAQQQGVAKGMFNPGWEWQAKLHMQAQRSVEIFRIWREVFGADADRRVVRVLATQAAFPASGEAVLSWQNAYREADAVAIAPYFSCDGDYLRTGKLINPGAPTAAAGVLKAGVNGVLDNCQRAINQEIRVWITLYKALADKYDLDLIGYEGGQHLAGIAGGENNEAVNKIMYAANRHPRMRTMYAQYLSQWRELGGGTLALFASGGSVSKWGSWGLVEYEGQPIDQAPKYLAVDEAMQGLGQRPAVIARPTVTALSTRGGATTGGSTMTIRGTNLASVSAVRFGKVRATLKTVTPTQLTATVPPSVAGGVVDVTVENPIGTTTATPATTYTYIPPPAVQALSTSTASVVNGTEVTITGTDLSGATTVTVGKAVVRKVKVLSPTALTFTAPPSAAGTVDVTVTTPYGTSKAVAAGRLTYVNPPRPAVTGLSVDQGMSNVSTTVVLTGTDFTGTTAVTVGPARASFTVLSNTQLRAVFPAQKAGTWDNVRVTTPGGTSAGTPANYFRYLAPPKPTVTALSVHRGTMKATTVVVTGTNFTGTKLVMAAGVKATFKVTSATQLTITVPGRAARATGHVIVTNAGGESTAAGDRTAFSW
ncbi:IPT/TIG domain-containing protein [Actinoplanes sp. NPDC051346]|uniref:IPT/TIG domain-containing protein n=1 Tax=Actinoplanes sp. NPDC051346 TaxID=3155048 RepID=UPI0034335C94